MRPPHWRRNPRRRGSLHTLYETGLRYITGAALSTMSSFLVLRGLKRTLALRMEWHSTTALAIAQVRDGHSAVG